VTRGTNLGDDSEVALKFTRQTPDIMKSKWLRCYYAKVMAREVEVLKMVEHENIIRMLEHHKHADFPESDGSTTDSTLLVLEYASKGTLKEFILRSGRFAEDLARTYFGQIVSGLEALQALKIAHRDLKPCNMLITEDYTLKICDFGFSKPYYDAEKKEDIVETYADYGFVCDRSLGGTRRYRSPEINKAEKDKALTYCGNQCDIFALGVTLFIMRFGRGPFKEAIELDLKWDYLSNAINMKTDGKYADAARYRKMFWRKHGKKQDDFHEKHSALTNLLFAMMHPNPLRRHNLFEVRHDKWMEEKPCSKAELKELMNPRWITLCTHKKGKKN